MKNSFNMIFFYFSAIQGHVPVQLVVSADTFMVDHLLENLLGLLLPFFLSATGVSGLAYANLKKPFWESSHSCPAVVWSFSEAPLPSRAQWQPFFLLWKKFFLLAPVAAMVPDVQDSDLWMRLVKYPPKGEFSPEALEILPAAAWDTHRHREKNRRALRQARAIQC